MANNYCCGYIFGEFNLDYTGKCIITQILSECSGLDGTEDYYSSQNEENEDKNRYSQILPSKLKSTPHAHGVPQY